MPAPRPPVRRAVALAYQRGRQRAPVVVATGRGRIAEQIIALARAHGVPIREDPALVMLLARLDVGDLIPPELYAVVAEVFAWVYRLNAERARRASR